MFVRTRNVHAHCPCLNNLDVGVFRRHTVDKSDDSEQQDYPT